MKDLLKGERGRRVVVTVADASVGSIVGILETATNDAVALLHAFQQAGEDPDRRIDIAGRLVIPSERIVLLQVLEGGA